MSTTNSKHEILDIRISFSKETDAGIPFEIDYRDENGRVYKTTEHVPLEKFFERLAELLKFSA